MSRNPEVRISPPPLSPRMMFNYDRGLNKSWNMSAYKTPRAYHDYNMEVQKRKWATQKKGQKSDRYVTKKGFYMDYHIKVQKSIPSPNEHNQQNPWTFQKEQKQAKNRKLDTSLKKNSYIDQIENQQTKRKKPGIGTYSIEKSLKQKQEQIQRLKRKVVKATQKRYFYENTEQLSDSVPGSSNYYPHSHVDKTKINRSDYKFWVDKHRKESMKQRQRDLVRPTAGTYSPLNNSYKTFDLLSKSSSTSLSKRNGFGSDSRFPYLRPQKKKIKEVRPSPASYNTITSWRGKGVNSKGKFWHQALWKGATLDLSIYRQK